MAPRGSASVPECLALETRDQILSPRLRSPRVCREVADRRASLGWRVVFRPVHELCDAVPPCRGVGVHREVRAADPMVRRVLYLLTFVSIPTLALYGPAIRTTSSAQARTLR